MRQAAVLELTGGGCRCARCEAEAALPAELQQQIADLQGRVQREWAPALEAAAAAGDEGTLATLWVGLGTLHTRRPMGLASIRRHRHLYIRGGARLRVLRVLRCHRP